MNSLHIWYSNDLADLNKEFLPFFESTQNISAIICSQKIPPNKFLPKNSSQKIPKRIQRKSEKFPKKFSKNCYDFENIQFPTSQLEAEHPFVLFLYLENKNLPMALIDNNVIPIDGYQHRANSYSCLITRKKNTYIQYE